jgi:hypothetical protein
MPYRSMYKRLGPSPRCDGQVVKLLRSHGRCALKWIWRPRQFLSVLLPSYEVSNVLCHELFPCCTFGPCTSPKGNGPRSWHTENSKDSRQYKYFLLLIWLSQVFCNRDRNLINTGNYHSIPKSNTDRKEWRIQLFLYPKGKGRDRAHWIQSVSFYCSSLNRITQLAVPYILPYY